MEPQPVLQKARDRVRRFHAEKQHPHEPHGDECSYQPKRRSNRNKAHAPQDDVRIGAGAAPSASRTPRDDDRSAIATLPLETASNPSKGK